MPIGALPESFEQSESTEFGPVSNVKVHIRAGAHARTID
jgi:hypothetical protein